MDTSTNLQNDIDAILEREGIPECAIAVMNKDGILWQRQFGNDCDKSEKQFHYFSGTKLYTAVAVLKLSEENKLNLDDYVTQHLPDWGDYLDGITIQHLLSHSSGLLDTPIKAFLSANFSSTQKPSTLEALNKFTIKRARAPGKLSSYANVNYAILGYLIERVTGQTYSQYMTDQVLKPLGSNACFSFREATNLTAGWIGYWNSIAAKMVVDPTQYKLLFQDSQIMPDGKRGAGLYSLADFDVDAEAIGGLVGKVEDFCPLVMEVLRHAGTTADDEQPKTQPLLLSPETIQRSVTKQYTGQVGVHSKDGAGLGWKIGKDFVNHEGGGPGFTSETRCYLQDGIGIVILLTRWSLTHRECTISHDICELIRNVMGKK